MKKQEGLKLYKQSKILFSAALIVTILMFYLASAAIAAAAAAPGYSTIEIIFAGSSTFQEIISILNYILAAAVILWLCWAWSFVVE